MAYDLVIIIIGLLTGAALMATGLYVGYNRGYKDAKNLMVEVMDRTLVPVKPPEELTIMNEDNSAPIGYYTPEFLCAYGIYDYDEPVPMTPENLEELRRKGLPV